ncbi:MAG: ATP-grasp domain-containing protein [Methylotenera sp.]
MKVKQEKLLVCEFITGGGISDEPLPESLAREGALMRDALLRDLRELQQYQITCLHDVRFGASIYAHKNTAVLAGEFKKTFKKALKQTDFVWLIAPETDGILLGLTELCLAAEIKENGSILLGCGYDATLVGTSKTLSFEALQTAKIHTLPVYSGEDLLVQSYFDEMTQLSVTKWVAKPEDGAGCEGLRLFDTLETLREWIKQDNQYLHYFAQPYQTGIVASFSMVCRDGKAWLLSCNQQHICGENNTFRLASISVNGLQTYWQRFETLARKIAKILPDALGYVGVDVIIDTELDKIFVIDINPRLTSSYVGLRESIGYNPAKIILDCILQANFKLPVLQRNIVEIHFE